MNEKVKEFLDAKKAEEIKKYEKEKADTLLELGLYEKEYSPTNSYSSEYSYYEWDETIKANRYFKIASINITDEEYEEIKKYNREPEVIRSNPVANIFKVIAWVIFIIGFIIGLTMGIELAEYSEEFAWGAAFIYWCISFVIGMMFIGFAEIISLLEKIKNK